MPDSVKDAEMKSLHDILEEITGIVPNTGKKGYWNGMGFPSRFRQNVTQQTDRLWKRYEFLGRASIRGFRPFLCTQYVKSPHFYITLLAFTYTMRIKQ